MVMVSSANVEYVVVSGINIAMPVNDSSIPKALVIIDKT
jgi:hypothetical protein